MSASIYRLQTSHITVLPKIQFGFPSDAVKDNTNFFKDSKHEEKMVFKRE